MYYVNALRSIAISADGQYISLIGSSYWWLVNERLIMASKLIA